MPLIGSLVRSLQLQDITYEPGESRRQPRLLCTVTTPLQRARTWSGEEERRRLFWAVFALDRYDRPRSEPAF
jgi:hypothetical protein